MLAFVTMLVAASGANAGIRPLLRHQGFAGPINGREKIEYVGRIRQGRDDYQVYTYQGVFRAAVVDHGVNRLIVVHNGTTLVGSYAASQPIECEVRGQRVICNAGVIAFTKVGPPRRVNFDDEVQMIDLGIRVRK